MRGIKMAYGNWGAWIWLNDKHIPEREDQTPFKEDKLKAGYHQAFQRKEGTDPHHAVLGNGDVRLCLYKSTPILFLKGKKVKLQKYCKNWGKEDDYFEAEHYPHNTPLKGDIKGYTFTISADYCGNEMIMTLKEPNGDIWKCEGGFTRGTSDDNSPMYFKDLLIEKEVEE